MYKDIRMEEVSKEEAEDFIEGLCGSWIYIKNICNIDFEEERKQTATYAKFRVKYVQTKYGTIEIYGEEDQDRLMIDYKAIVSFQMTPEEDEVLFGVEKENVSIIITIKKYLPTLMSRLSEIEKSNRKIIVTEGKTDWKHMKRALMKFQENGEYQNFDFEFFEYEDDVPMGADTLMSVCKYNSLFENPYLKIFVFDADKEEINKEHEEKGYVYHGNNVFSIIIPVPYFRQDTPLISIENYYTDEEIKIEDSNGRRLYLNSEFDHESGRLKSDISVIDLDVSKHRKMGANYIIDKNVYKVDIGCSINKEEVRRCGESIALSKSSYADNVLGENEHFTNVGYESFRLIFDEIMRIEEEYKKIPLDVTVQKDLEFVETEGDIVIRQAGNGLKVLEVHIETPDVLKRHGRIRDSLHEIKEEGGEICIVVYVTGYRLRIPLTMTDELLFFLLDKVGNHYNRIELYLHEEDRVGIIELLSGEMGSALIQRMFRAFSSENSM